MAKKQTRRTVSLGIGHYTRLVEYARANGASASQVTEFALDIQFKAPLDPEAFRNWRGDRIAPVAAERRRSAENAYRERERAHEERRAARAVQLAELAAAVESARTDRAARRERLKLRAQIRFETGVTQLCWLCDGPHRQRFCPSATYVPAVTGSRSERAAKAAHDERITFRDAAERFGISFQAVQHTFRRLYPNEERPRSVPDRVTNEIAVNLAKLGRSLDDICEETGFSADHIYKLCRVAGVSVGPSVAKRSAFEAAIAAVAAGSSLGEAAADHGVSWGRLRERCRDRGVESSGKCGPNGRAVAAADLVQNEGLTVPAAARRMRCAPPAVSTVLRRRSA